MTTTTTTSKEFSSLPPPIPDRPSSPSLQLLSEQHQQQLDVTEPLSDKEGPRKSGRITRPPIHFGRNAEEIPDEDPTTYRQAINSSLRDQWTSAINDQITALRKNNTFEVVDKPIGQNIIDSKWVFKTKKNADGTLESGLAEQLPRNTVKYVALTLKLLSPQSSVMNPSASYSQSVPKINGHRDNSM